MFSLFKKDPIIESFKPAYIILGIGNIGSEYDETRHNIGFKVIDSLIRESNSVFRETLCESDVYGVTIHDKNVLLVKPNTYVNESGVALKELCEKFTVSVENTLVIVDDFHLDIGRVRVRRNGSHGGHNGLRSIIDNLGKNFPRLRVGIGPKSDDVDIIDFVLGKFSSDVLDDVEKSAEKACDAVLYYINSDIVATMNEFNNKLPEE